MTAPFAVGGAGGTPAASALEFLGASPSAAGANNASLDPAFTPFAGVLARVVGVQGSNAAEGPNSPEAVLKAALASLEAAMGESAPASDAGTAAIRALIEQVSKQNASAAATATAAANTAAVNAAVANTAAANTAAVDAATQALGAAAMIAPTTAPVTAPLPATNSAKDVKGTEDSKDDESAKTKTDGDTSGATTANTRGTTTASIDPAAVLRDLNALDPAFRAKLDRVIERMQNEFGHAVTVVETVRSQARQDALYEMGRTAPGQVVTWTRASRHGDGLAADVMIDGGYDNTIAFDRLQRIANEEGLHTLGSRDAGHLELRIPQSGGFTTRIASGPFDPPSLKNGANAAASLAATTAQSVSEAASQDAMARITRVAQVAHVAATAGVARVAGVANIATPGAVATQAAANAAAATSRGLDAAQLTKAAAAATSATIANTNAVNASAANTNAANAAASNAAAAQGVRTEASNAANAATALDNKQTKANAAKTSATNAASVASAVNAAANKSATRERQSDTDERTSRRNAELPSASGDGAGIAFVAPARTIGAATAVNAAIGPDQAGRVGQIDALQAKANAQPMSSMVLNLDDGKGGTDRIRVDVRGSSVQSTIDVRDQQAATDLSARTSELARALESRGLESEGVRVRTMAQPASADALRQAAGGEAVSPRGLAAALATDPSNPSRRDRDDARDQRSAFARQEQESQRQRSEREREEYQP